MKSFYTIISVLILSSGCAHRTYYQPMGENGGFSDMKVRDHLYTARFAGNAYTKAREAFVLAQFRALEVCADNHARITRIFSTTNRSTSQTVQRSSSNTSNDPVNIVGGSSSTTSLNQGYGNPSATTNSYGASTLTGGNTQTQKSSWNETYNYPTFDVLFACSDNVYMTRLLLKEIKSPESQKYAEDGLPVLQLGEFMAASPGKGKLKIGDVILKVNDERVPSLIIYGSEIDSSKNKNEIPFVVVREGKQLTLMMQAIDGASDFLEYADKIRNEACMLSDVKSRPLCGHTN